MGRVPTRIGAEVVAMYNDNGTCLGPGLVRAVRDDYAHILLTKSGGGFMTETYRLGSNEYVERPSNEQRARWVTAYLNLTFELRRLAEELPPMSGGRGVTCAYDLIGRWVTMMLYNGSVIAGVKILRRESKPADYAMNLCYRLPGAKADSKVPITAIGFLYVHAEDNDNSRTRGPAGSDVTIGDMTPNY